MEYAQAVQNAVRGWPSDASLNASDVNLSEK